VNNYKLSRSYTSYSDPSELATYFGPGKDRPVIQFKPDGKFIDEGLFAIHDSLVYWDPALTKPGKGTYELKDYTLILNYDDSRKKVQSSFTFKYGPDIKDASDSIIIFSGFRLYQMP
jgi:hypothetical protein